MSGYAPLLVLDLGFDIVDSIGRFDLKGDGRTREADNAQKQKKYQLTPPTKYEVMATQLTFLRRSA